MSLYHTGNTKNAINTMKTKCNVKHQLLNESNNKDKDHSEINKFLCKSNTNNSMIYCKFQIIKEQIKSEVLNCSENSENISNEYYDESYLQNFITKRVSFLALYE